MSFFDYNNIFKHYITTLIKIIYLSIYLFILAIIDPGQQGAQHEMTTKTRGKVSIQVERKKKKIGFLN